jgi:hypothetical protein
MMTQEDYLDVKSNLVENKKEETLYIDSEKQTMFSLE